MRPLIKRSKHFTETSIDDEIVIMRLDTGAFFALSETAAAAWRLIDGRRDREDLLATLALRYDLDRSILNEDIDRLLDDLRGADLLEQG